MDYESKWQAKQQQRVTLPRGHEICGMRFIARFKNDGRLPAGRRCEQRVPDGTVDFACPHGEPNGCAAVRVRERTRRLEQVRRYLR